MPSYTIFDFIALNKVQGVYQSRPVSRVLNGTKNVDYLFGDGAAVGTDDGYFLKGVDDKIFAGSSGDAIYGGVGNDWLNGQSGDDLVDGGAGEDLLLGDIGKDTLFGGDGNDLLNGGSGIDVMHGGKGDDTYWVDNAEDSVVEVSTETGELSSDTVVSVVSYGLGANVENLILSGGVNINGEGNSLNNVICGNGGVNILTGGLGNDSYYVQNKDDQVIELSPNSSKEWNVVFSSVTYSLMDGSQVDEFVLIGASNSYATGNDLDNLIEGNAGNNRLYGKGGNDILCGVPIDVTLKSDFSGYALITATYTTENGIDTLYGGAGDDVLFLGRNDIAIEEENEGYDTVVSGSSRVLGDNIECLDFYGKLGSADGLVGTGNSLDNYFVSNLGADTLTGLQGDDTYEIFNSRIMVKEKVDAGLDTVRTHVDFKLQSNVENLILCAPDGAFNPVVGIGNSLNNLLMGNFGDNILNGLEGDDTLIGGGGNDFLTGGVGSDRFVFEPNPSAAVTINDFVSGEDKIVLDGAALGLMHSNSSLAPEDFLSVAAGGKMIVPDANQHLLFDTDTGLLYYDSDGVDVEEGVVIAILYPGLSGYSLSVGDFFMV